jgi:hypothetical protein
MTAPRIELAIMSKTSRFLVTLALLALAAGPLHAQSVTVTWDPNSESDIVSYTVFYGTQSGVYTESQAVGKVTTWTASDLKAGKTYYFAVQAMNADGLASPLSAEVSATIPGSATWVPASPRLDVDNDGLSDVTVFRPSTGTWFTLDSSSGNTAFRYKGWGVQAQNDTPVVGDFDGDGLLDPTVFRPAAGTWFILYSAANYTTWNAFGWGVATDTPVPGDYDGDGITDAAVYRSSTGTWYVRPSSGASQWSVVFGQSGDVPVAGDFDGDGKRDPAVFRSSTGTWFWLKSSTNYTEMEARGWGVQAQADEPVPGDYDGDGKTDLCVFRPGTGTWFVLESQASLTTWKAIAWGLSGDKPAPADYDGDGKTDAAVFRPSDGKWYVKPSSGATEWNVVFGNSTDVPLIVK